MNSYQNGAEDIVLEAATKTTAYVTGPYRFEKARREIALAGVRDSGTHFTVVAGTCQDCELMRCVMLGIRSR